MVFLKMFSVEKTVDDVQLIQCVKDRPELYDTTHVKYMDTNHKNGLWNEIGEELQVSSTTCKTRWGNIRDNYRKSLRKSISKRSRGLKSVKHYKYADHLWFLKKCFDVDEMGDGLLPGVEIKQEEDTLIQIDPQDDFSDDDSHCQSPVYTSQKKRKIKQETMEQTQSSASSTPQHYSTQKLDESVASNVAPDCVDAFLASLAPTLKNLSPIDWHFAKGEIFSIVQKFELKTILGIENEQSSLT